jgi:hypothetical protein
VINQDIIHKRRIVICGGCNEVMEAGGTWPVSQKVLNNKLVLDSNEVATHYYCRTESCRVNGAGLVRIPRRERIIESDLFVGPPNDPKYEWEISTR